MTCATNIADVNQKLVPPNTSQQYCSIENPREWKNNFGKYRIEENKIVGIRSRNIRFLTSFPPGLLAVEMLSHFRKKRYPLTTKKALT